MPTLTLPAERREWFPDSHTGQWSIEKDNESVLDYVIDWSRILTGGETITTSSWNADGVTLASTANSETTVTIWVAKSGGTAKNTIVTSGGRTHVRTLRFVLRQM